jgi:hypothetical protein
MKNDTDLAIRFATRNPQVIELRQPRALEKLLVT